ncbi:hypothetical protein FPV16_18305 [Methylobacterium sp. W2]|uniref:hypothetical protein n=1 Tax=Methylobacterium sp. W2 TaxID=2598107 RepID=UPI001D0C63F1|nr:hypothetical protein [Methylobacterium sp. W2]MCC0808138.1 hypothetical protein [Methylobacterium sp. W2]
MPAPRRPTVSDTLLLLALATENVELRAQLAEVQDQCVELAVDAGELHAEVERLQGRLAVVERDRDRWRAQAAHRCAG